MKKLMTALLAVSALAAAVPAVAQPHDRGGRQEGTYGYGAGGNQQFEREYQRLAERIQRGQRTGAISYREADRLNQQLRSLRQLDRRYRADRRLSRWEAQDLRQRIDRLERQIRIERRDGDNRRN